MRAIVVHEGGGAEVLHYEEVAEPEPGPNDVLSRCLAAGVNFSDIGRRKNPPHLPLMLGSEAAGIILAVGSEVDDFAVGDYVACHDYERRANGSYAEQVICGADKTVRVPAEIVPTVAVSVLLQALTAYSLAYGAYPVSSGDTILVHSAAGGVGILLTQMAHNAGARVIGTVSSPAKVKIALDAGADLVIDYMRQDFAETVLGATSGAGVNAIYDAVGETTFRKNFKCIAGRGTVVMYGSASGPVAPFSLAQLGSRGAYLTVCEYDAFRTYHRSMAQTNARDL